MQSNFLILCISFLVNFVQFDHGYTNIKEERQAIASHCSCTLASASQRSKEIDHYATSQNHINFGQTSFQGHRLPGTSTNGSTRVIPMAMCMRKTERETTYVLSHMPAALEQRTAAFQCSEVATSSCPTVAMGLGLQPEDEAEERANEALESGRSKRERTSPQRRRQRKRKQRCREQRAVVTARSSSSHPTMALSRSSSQLSTRANSTDTICNSSSRRGVTCSSSEVLSGPCKGPGRYQKRSGQGRQSDLQSPIQRPQSSIQPGRKSCPTSGFSEGCQNRTPTKLVEAFARFSQQLAKAAAALQRSAEGIWRSTTTCPAGIDCSQKATAATQQAGSRSWCTNLYRSWRHRPRDSRWGQWSCLRSRSQCTCATSARELATEHSCSCRSIRNYGDQLRRRCRPKEQKTSLYGALRHSNGGIGRAACLIATLVNIGSADLCPSQWNRLRVPVLHQEAPEFADAYRPQDVGAACKPDLAFDPIRFMIRCHSIHWEPTFLSEPSALASATCLRNEVLGNGVQPAYRPAQSNDANFDRPSSLRTNSKIDICKKVKFVPLAEIFESYFPPRFEPHHDRFETINQEVFFSLDNDVPDDCTSFMARRPHQVRQPQSSPESDSDLHTHEPTSPSSVSEQADWQSVQVYDLRSNIASGRVRTRPPAAAFIETRRLLGYRHHDVASIYDINPVPSDLHAARVQPLILLAHEDIRFGDNRRAILIDVEIHGSNFDSVIEIDRYTAMIPTPIHRSLLLKITGVAAYCKLRQDRCLLWHHGQLVPHQNSANLELSHGDYVRVAVPPFAQPEIPTYFAIRACQHGLNHGQIVHRYHTNPDPDDFHTEIEAEQEIADVNALMQVSTSLDLSFTRCKTHQHFGAQENATSFERASPSHFPNHRRLAQEEPRPSWFQALHHDFVHRSAVECEEEGPIAFLTTWFVSGSHEQVSEESRILRLDQQVHLWISDIVHLWRDKIQMARPVHFAIV